MPARTPIRRIVVSDLVAVLPLVGIALLFWLLFVRPAKRRQSEMGRMQREMTVGDEVMLTSGIFGTVRAIDDDSFSLEVADGTTLKVLRAAVGNVVTPATRSRDEDHDADTDMELVADEPEEKQ
jgi:preprotein translocase subunit YajC